LCAYPSSTTTYRVLAHAAQRATEAILAAL
jgi:hypothetical protein